MLEIRDTFGIYVRSPYNYTMMRDEQRENQATVETSRLFVALPLSASVRELVAETQRALRGHDWPVKWVSADQAHITLKFLGETPNKLVPRIEHVLGNVARKHRPVDLQTGHVGGFPSPSRPQVLWIGLDGDAGQLAGLASEIDSGLTALGFDAERRPFRAHITLGRVRRGRLIQRDAGQVLRALDVPARAVHFDRFQLIQSVLGRSGPRYTTLAEWRLGVATSGEEAGRVELVEHG